MVNPRFRWHDEVVGNALQETAELLNLGAGFESLLSGIGERIVRATAAKSVSIALRQAATVMIRSRATVTMSVACEEPLRDARASAVLVSGTPSAAANAMYAPIRNAGETVGVVWAESVEQT